MNTFCGWMAALTFMLAFAWSLSKEGETIDYIVQFLMGVAFTMFVWILLTL